MAASVTVRTTYGLLPIYRAPLPLREHDDLVVRVELDRRLLRRVDRDAERRRRIVGRPREPVDDRELAAPERGLADHAERVRARANVLAGGLEVDLVALRIEQ